MACCVQTYLRFPDLNTYTIPSDDVRRRQLRQRMGEDFLEFMDVWWSDKINSGVEKKYAMEAYFQTASHERRFVNSTRFKEKVRAYCEYNDLLFNPGADKAGRVRSGNEEFILVANDQFIKEDMQLIR